jgi:hypothetical protein
MALVYTIHYKKNDDGMMSANKVPDSGLFFLCRFIHPLLGFLYLVFFAERELCFQIFMG